MNDEYLWQKTGKDPEIESLENALAVFRYREDPPPSPPVEKAVSLVRPSRWRISLPLAFATCVGIAVLAVGLQQAIKDSSEDAAGKLEEIVFVQGSTDAEELPPPVQPPAPPSQKSDRPTTPSGIRRPKLGRTNAAFRRKPKVKDGAPKDTIAALTKEERFAYRQLMLALSITGSQLKIVKNTIDGSDPDTLSNDKR